MSFNDTELPATLVDGETTKPRRLSTAGTPEGLEPEVGDIAYYAPWGNQAIFYEDFDYSPGLVKLGRIHSGIEVLAGNSGEVTVTVSRSTP